MFIWTASIELANKVYTLAYVALVIGAIMTAASTMSLFWASAIRDRYSDEKIAGAEAVAAQARTEQVRLEADLEREKTQRAEFEAQFSWRIIDEATMASITAELSKAPHVVAIEFSSGDREAEYFARQITKALEDAKWQIALRSVPAFPMLFGLDVPGPENEATVALRSALIGAGIGVVSTAIPVPGIFMGTDEGNKLTPEARLLVGAKLTSTILKTFRP